MRTQSLTRVLTGGVLVANLVCSASFSVVATIHEMHGRRRAFDVMLRGRADSLLAALKIAPDGAHGLAIDRATAPAGDLYEVLGVTGNVVSRSANSTPQVLADFNDNPTAEYFDFAWQGEGYRGFRRLDDSRPLGLQVVYASSTADLRSEAVEAARYYATFSFALLLPLTLLSMWFLRSRLLPLKELARRAGMVSSASWEFDPPQAALSIRELQPIAISIKKLVEGLRLSFERQREFTGNAAHELKTSIALLKSSLQLLSMRQRSAEEYERGLADLAIDIRRMEELTQQMLTVARLEEEPVKPGRVIDFAAIVRLVALRLGPFSSLRQVTVRLDVAESQPARIREEDAEILCSNLMMNALQHSPAESTMTVSVASWSNMVELRVSDSGDGIPASALPRIFDRFYRVDASRSRQSGGTGLGLTMCKAIVDRSGGTIEIKSEVGKGTDVIVRIPAEPTV